MKYINALEGRRGPPILNSASLAAIVARPSITPTGEFVALTWRIDQLTTGGAHWWHSGGGTGTRTLLARRQNNRDWVVLMNSRPLDENTIITEIFDAFAKAETQVTSWPTNDLFADFGRPTLSDGVQSLEFTYVLGSAVPAPQTVQVISTPTPVSYTIPTPTAAWLSVNPAAGSAPSAVRVTVNPSGLQPGTFQASFTVSAPQAANSSRTLPVSLTISAEQGFTAIRNSASMRPVTFAAPASRIVIESPEIDADPVTLTFAGSDSVELTASIVEMKPARIDLVVPPGLPLGDATVTLTKSTGKLLRGRLKIEPVSPGLFTASGDGAGAPLGTLTTTDGDGNTSTVNVYDCSTGTCEIVPIDLGSEATAVTLQLAATGVRGQSDLSVTIGDQTVEVLGIEQSLTAPGIDLITVKLPHGLGGLGDVDMAVTAGGRTTNPVRITIL